MEHNSGSKIAENEIPQFRVIIPAAGSGKRFKSEIPKQYHVIGNKTVLRHTIDIFANMSSCTEIYVIIDPDDANMCHDAIQGVKNIHFLNGGKERKDSVYNALNGISNIKNEEIILIHDAARPCVSAQHIAELLIELNTSKAATLATPISSTLRRSNLENEAQDIVNREHLWSIQTPQGFRYGDLLEAHEQSDPSKSYTDDTELVSDIGIPVKLVESPETNIKVTRPSDLKLAEMIMKAQND